MSDEDKVLLVESPQTLRFQEDFTGTLPGGFTLGQGQYLTASLPSMVDIVADLNHGHPQLLVQSCDHPVDFNLMMRIQ